MIRSNFHWRADGDPAVVGHRGIGRSRDNVTIRENTIPAFRQALSDGADWIETDIQLTIDNVLILHHNLRDQDGMPIRKLTAEQAEQRGWERLAEVQANVPSSLGFNIELKLGAGDCDNDRLVDSILDAVAHQKERRWVITSFDPSIPYVVRRKALARNINPPPTGWITEQGWPYGKAVVAAIRSGSQVAVLHADDVLTDTPLLSDAPTVAETTKLVRKSGLAVMAWGVTKDNAEALMERGVSGLCTDTAAEIHGALIRIGKR